MNIRNPQSKIRNRKGAVAVEFAIVAPILVAVLFGLIGLGRAFEMQNLLEVAAREGARFASMDREGMLDPNESANQKLIDDVKAFLASNGINAEDITVEVKDHENPSDDFDLDDPENDLKLFEVRISVDWSDVSLTPVSGADDHPLTAKVVFRNGRATISE
ncbi:MAG: TadE family protein [Pirellulales bacterium]